MELHNSITETVGTSELNTNIRRSRSLPNFVLRSSPPRSRDTKIVSKTPKKLSLSPGKIRRISKSTSSVALVRLVSLVSIDLESKESKMNQREDSLRQFLYCKQQYPGMTQFHEPDYCEKHTGGTFTLQWKNISCLISSKISQSTMVVYNNLNNEQFDYHFSDVNEGISYLLRLSHELGLNKF